VWRFKNVKCCNFSLAISVNLIMISDIKEYKIKMWMIVDISLNSRCVVCIEVCFQKAFKMCSVQQKSFLVRNGVPHHRHKLKIFTMTCSWIRLFMQFTTRVYMPCPSNGILNESNSKVWAECIEPSTSQFYSLAL